jgi:glycosyltransferase involved in cell wall biosynthesis
VRVFHIAEGFGGGLYEVLRTVANRLVAEGHEMTIAYGRRLETPEAVAEGFDPAVSLLPMRWERRSAGSQLAAARELRRLARRAAPDVIHVHSSFAGAVAALALPRGAPTIYTPHAYAFTRTSESRPRRAAYRSVEWMVARRMGLVAATSHDEAALAREVLGAPRVTAVPNGIPELDDPSPEGPPPDGRAVAAMGRPGAQRRPEACARILSALGEAAEPVWIGGGEPGSPGVAALLSAGVPVTGWLSHAEALERLAGATAYLHWTAWDGLPLSILEAMARDVVVVASDIGPNREVLGAAQVAHDEASAAALLRRVVDDRDFRESLLRCQRARRSAYSAERMVREWLAVYRRMAAVPRGRAPRRDDW